MIMELFLFCIEKIRNFYICNSNCYMLCKENQIGHLFISLSKVIRISCEVLNIYKSKTQVLELHNLWILPKLLFILVNCGWSV